MEDLDLQVYEDEVLESYKDAVDKPCVILFNILSKRQAIYIAEHFQGSEPLYILKDDIPICVGGIDLNLDSMMKLRVLSEGMMISHLAADGSTEDFNLREQNDFVRMLLTRG